MSAEIARKIADGLFALPFGTSQDAACAWLVGQIDAALKQRAETARRAALIEAAQVVDTSGGLDAEPYRPLCDRPVASERNGGRCCRQLAEERRVAARGKEA